MGEAIDGRNRELLEAKNFCHVATLRPDGTPHTALVWVDVEGDQVVINSAKGRAWPTNLERDPRVTLTVANMENPYEYVSVRGRMVEMTSEGADEHVDRMTKKYLGQDTYPFRQPGEERVIVRIEPEHVHHFGH